MWGWITMALILGVILGIAGAVIFIVWYFYKERL
jgi:ATP/ADP translocase